MNRQTAACGLTAAMAFICTSCVSSPAPLPSPSSSVSGPQLTGTISVTGAVPFSSTFNASAAIEVAGKHTPARVGSNCAEYANGFDQSAKNGGGKGFDAPEVQSAKVNHHSVFVSVSMATGYAGPGTYDSRRNSSLGGYASRDVDNPSGVETTTFSSSIHGLTTLTVNPDGSGALDVIGWGTTEVHGLATISAAITWICNQCR